MAFILFVATCPQLNLVMTVVLHVLVQAQLKPLMDQLSRVKDLPVPEFGNLQAWEARASAAVRAAGGDINAGDSKMSQLGYNGVPLPYRGDTKVTFFCLRVFCFLHVEQQDNYVLLPHTPKKNKND